MLLEVTLAELRENFPGCAITVATNDFHWLAGDVQTRFVGSFTRWVKSTVNGASRWHWRQLPLMLWWVIQSWLVALTCRLFKRPWLMPGDRARYDLLAAYCQADLIVSCPGNFFFSSSGLGVPFLLSVYALAYGWLLGKPLYMMPQTIGPLTRRRERWPLRWVLQRLRFVTLRDTPSLATVTALGIPASRCHIMPDSAFLYGGSGDLGPFIDLITNGSRGLVIVSPTDSITTGCYPRPYVGVTVIDWAALNRRFERQNIYEVAVADALAVFLKRHGGTVFIFPQVIGPSQAEDDRLPAARVAEILGASRSQVVQVKSAWLPGQLQAAYGQMDLFLGTRLHSNMFALTAGTPTLAISYQYKTHGVFSMLGLSDWVIDIENVDGLQLSELLESLWQQRASVRDQLSGRLPVLKQAARNAAAWIAADFHRVAVDMFAH